MFACSCRRWPVGYVALAWQICSEGFPARCEGCVEWPPSAAGRCWRLLLAQSTAAMRTAQPGLTGEGCAWMAGHHRGWHPLTRRPAEGSGHVHLRRVRQTGFVVGGVGADAAVSGLPSLSQTARPCCRWRPCPLPATMAAARSVAAAGQPAMTVQTRSSPHHANQLTKPPACKPLPGAMAPVADTAAGVYRGLRQVVSS